MNLEQTADVQFIRSIVTHPDVFPYVVDEGHAPETWQPPLNDNLAWLKCDGIAGVALVYRVSGVIYAYDAALLPEARAKAVGYKERRGHIELLKNWLRLHTDCQHLIAIIACDNERSIAAAKADGLKLEGNLPKSKWRGGRLIDALVFGTEI